MAAFELGVVVATPGALEAFREAGESIDGSPLLMFPYLDRHAAGDWGDLGAHDRHANNKALKDGTRLLSAYVLPGGQRIWVITEASREVTTLLLPSEY